MVYYVWEFKWGWVKVSQGEGRWGVDELRGMDFSFHPHNFASLEGNKARSYKMGGKSVVSIGCASSIVGFRTVLG